MIIAPVESRVKAIVEQENVSRKVAERRVEENDKARSSYIQRHYGVDWLDCSLYSQVIDTERIPRNLAVELITKTAQVLS